MAGFDTTAGGIRGDLNQLTERYSGLVDEVAVLAGIIEAWQVERVEANRARYNKWYRRAWRWMKS